LSQLYTMSMSAVELVMALALSSASSASIAAYSSRRRNGLAIYASQRLPGLSVLFHRHRGERNDGNGAVTIPFEQAVAVRPSMRAADVHQDQIGRSARARVKPVSASTADSTYAGVLQQQRGQFHVRRIVFND